MDASGVLQDSEVGIGGDWVWSVASVRQFPGAHSKTS